MGTENGAFGTGKCIIEKTFSDSFNDDEIDYSGSWFDGITFYVEIDVDFIDYNLDASLIKSIPLPKSKNDFKDGVTNLLVDMNKMIESHKITGAFTTDDNSVPIAKLASNITSSSTSITLNDGSEFNTQGIALIDNELIYYSRSGNTLSIYSGSDRNSRGIYDTVASSHTAGNFVYDVTDSALGKAFKIIHIRRHGGTVNLYYDGMKIQGYITKISFKRRYGNIIVNWFKTGALTSSEADQAIENAVKYPWEIEDVVFGVLEGSLKNTTKS